jgi:NAD(P)-dependent dehydrogenase (short-subunit alcohol dehydrogenase family)
MKSQPVIIVTGASRGLGAAVGFWLGRIGAAVVLVARTRTDLEETAAAVQNQGGTSLIVPADIAFVDECAAVIGQALDRFGHLDALVNNAGIFEPLAAVADSNPDHWHANLAINLLGPYNLIRLALPHLRDRRGRIVNVSSGAASHTIPMASAYCVAKAGLNHLTRVLAEEEPLVTTVALRPGVVDTAMQAFIRTQAPGVMRPDQAAYYQNLKRDGQLEAPMVPARVIAWLALHAPRAYSGEFVSYDDARIRRPAEDFFGEVS